MESSLPIVSWGGVNVDKNMHDRDLYGNEKNFIFHGNVFYFAAVEDETTTFIFMHVRTHLLKRIHIKLLPTYYRNLNVVIKYIIVDLCLKISKIIRNEICWYGLVK